MKSLPVLFSDMLFFNRPVEMVETAPNSEEQLP